MKNYYVYMVTDIVTGEFYIGSRGYRGNIENDSYMGSYAVWKPIRENLEKTILRSEFLSLSLAIEYERELIIKHIDNPLNRNYSIPHPKLSRDNIVTGKTLDGKHVSVSCHDELYLSKQIVGITKGLVLVEKNGKKFYVSVDDPRYISGELIHANIGKIKGDSHPNWKKFWVNDGTKQYLVTEISEGLTIGTLQKGKKTFSSHSGSCWVTKDERSMRIENSELEIYLSSGWKRGREKKLCRNTIWINNGVNNKKVSSEALQNYLNDGWKQGQKNKT